MCADPTMMFDVEGCGLRIEDERGGGSTAAPLPVLCGLDCRRQGAGLWLLFLKGRTTRSTAWESSGKGRASWRVRGRTLSSRFLPFRLPFTLAQGSWSTACIQNAFASLQCCRTGNHEFEACRAKFFSVCTRMSVLTSACYTCRRGSLSTPTPPAQSLASMPCLSSNTQHPLQLPTPEHQTLTFDFNP